MKKKTNIRDWLKYVKNYKNNKWILDDYYLIKKSYENKKKKFEKDIEELKSKHLKEVNELQERISRKAKTIIENTDALNSRNNEIQELHKELSDKILENDELTDKNNKLEKENKKLSEENKKIKLTNEFLKNNRRAPTHEEIIAFEKNQREVLKRQKEVKS